MDSLEENSERKWRTRRPTKKNVIVAVGVAIAVMAGFFIYRHLFFVSTDNAQVEARTLMLSPKVSGFVARVMVSENQKVRAGDVLAELDSRDFESNLRQIEAEKGSLEAKARDAEKNFRRVSQLFHKGVVSRQQYDSAEALNRETNRKLQALDAQVEQARLNLSYTKIKAPVVGTIATKSIEVGMLLSAGTPIFGFVGSGDRWITANFKEVDLPNLSVGKRATVKIDALGGREFDGVIESISPATGATFTLLPPDNATGNFTKVVQRVPVRIKLLNVQEEDTDELRAGLSADVSVFVR